MIKFLIEKEFKQLLRNSFLPRLILIFPCMIMLLMPWAVNMEIKNIQLNVVDNDHSVISQWLVNKIAASTYFRLTEGQEMLPPNVSVSRLTPDVKLLYNPQMKSAYNFVPGVMGLILMLICAMMTSISIVREKETGTMEVLLVSPVKPLFIVLAKAVPYFVLSFVNLTTILLLSVFVLDVPVVGSLFWLVIVSLLFIFVSLALGLLISSVTSTQVAAMLASGMILMMPTMVLSGMIFPVESMPVILRAISDIIPARWYIQAVRKLMIEGVPVVLVLKEIGILLLMAVVLITISIRKFKYRLE